MHLLIFRHYKNYHSLKILKKSKIKYIEANTLEDAANKAVKALGK